MIKNLLKNKNTLLKILVLIIISVLYLGRSFNDFKEPSIKGDGLEYLLMTEALRNHFSPDITTADLIAFKERYTKYHGWNDFAPKNLDIQIEYFPKSKLVYKETTNMGFFCNRNGKWHCQHFFFYSLVNLPAYCLAKKSGPLRSFYITNALLVILTCFAFLFFTPFTLFNQVLSALCFCFSAAYWYLGWQHTEIFTMSLVALSLIVLFNKKNGLAILILALACLQNQPLVLLLGLFVLITLQQKGYTIKTILKYGLLAAIAFIPPLYYLINFGTTNLIADAGFLDTKYITANRVSGFYLDISQGMILAIPFILLAYLPLVFIEVRKMWRKEIGFDFSILIPLVVLCISITVSTMGNWNHGMAIINRYASWLGIVVMVHTFYLAHKLSHLRTTILFNYFFMTQFITVFYHQQFNKFDWSSGSFPPMAKWVLRNHPAVYNPDPMIFAGRVPPGSVLNPESSPIIYFHHKLVKKIMVHRNKIDDLKDYGFSSNDIADMKNKLKFNFDWAYINDGDYKSTLTGEQVFYKLRERKIQTVLKKIQTSPSWMEQIHQKAKSWNLTVEEVLLKDAEYAVSLGEKAEDED
ncbi:MAG: hypothetical protein KA163_01060 [Bacteroidia bacterium]|nr:hypothetical protein [Bacteroidia bacterium]